MQVRARFYWGLIAALTLLVIVMGLELKAAWNL